MSYVMNQEFTKLELFGEDTLTVLYLTPSL